MTWVELALDDDRDWERLAEQPSLAPDAVAARWLRAMQHGADTQGPPEEPMLTAGRIREHRERMGPVLRVLQDAIGPAVDGFAKRDFTLLFADRDGVIVGQHAGGGFAEAARRLRLQSGAVWDEPTRGTNAIGTALHEGCPVMVRGAAHLARANRDLICYAAPVHDPWGQLIGVLDATSMLDRASPVAGAAVYAAARAIEEALRTRSLQRAGGDIVTRLLQRIHDPALLVTPTGGITHANRAAVELELELGPRERRADGLYSVRRDLRDVLGIGVSELASIAAGRSDTQFIEVDVVRDPEDRIAAWLVLLPRKRAPSRIAPPATSVAFERISGDDPHLRRTIGLAGRLAPSDLPLLILGETGTGKELLARAVHDASHRAEGPFVPVNCAAIAPTLLHSELFGYRGGAFTGADPAGRDGRIAAAAGGTLFLDELAEMPMALQALLLRVLEQGVYQRVGDTAEARADVRVVCATCRDLPELVRSGAFRSDLYYRLHGATLLLPSLRERSDLPALTDALLAELATQASHPIPVLAEDARAAIRNHPWPGNIRELRMTLHRAMVLAGPGRPIRADHLLLQAPEPAGSGVPTPRRPEDSGSLEDQRLAAIRDALEQHDGNVSAAARQLGVARSTVYRTLKRG